MAREAYVIFFLLSEFAWQAHAIVNCTLTGAGRHGDLDDVTCQSYTLCIYVKVIDSYLAYNTVCPTDTVFSPKMSKCTSTTNYLCNNNKVKVSSEPKKSICTIDGYIADPNSRNCTTFISCVEINGTFTNTRYYCPNETYFNPINTFCEHDYNCTAFRCSEKGRFANESDFTCKTFYYCVEKFDRTYAQYKYTCPSISVFDPITKICNTRYVCA